MCLPVRDCVGMLNLKEIYFWKRIIHLQITLKYNQQQNPKAYIPLRRKTIRVGYWHWLGHPTPQFCVTYTNMLVSKNAKICITPNVTAKIRVTQTPTLNTSRWNIGGVGSPTQNSGIGHVDFMLFVSFSLALGSQRGHNFQWNMDLR